MISLRLNQVLSLPATPRKSSRILVICDINPKAGELALAEQLPFPAPFRTCRYHRKPTVMRIQQLEQALKSGQYRCSDAPLNPLLLDQKPITPKMSALRDRHWEMVRNVVEEPPILRLYLYGDGLGSVVHDLCEKFDCSLKHFYNVLHRCLSLGGVREACTPEYGKHRTVSHRTMEEPGHKRGRRPRYAAIQYRNWTDQDSTALLELFPKIRDAGKKSMEDLYVEYCFFVLQVVVDFAGPSRINTLAPGDKGLISFAQFKYHFEQLIPHLVLVRRRVGKINFDNNHRGVPGSSRFWVRGPTVRYEIDATVASIYLRYALSDGQRISIGKPHVFVVVDVFTTMYVGFYVTFLDEHWAAVAQALYCAFTDKVEVCAQFGIEIQPEEWPCQHPCDQITMDRGSQYSNGHLDSVLKSEIGCQRANIAPAFTGSAKGVVESAIHVLENDTKKMPGAVQKDRRDLQHPSNRALYTYRDFVRALIEIMIDHNKLKPTMQLLDENMVRHDVNATRLDVWNYGLKHYIGEKRQIPADTLRFALLPEADASITAKGILFKGRLYSNQACLEYLSMARSTYRTSIRIRHTKVTVDFIFWKAPDGTHHQLFLTEHSRRFRGASYMDAVVRIHIEKMAEAKGASQALAGKIQRFKNKQERDAQARKACAGATPQYRRSPQPGIREHKNAAADAERKTLEQAILDDLGFGGCPIDPTVQEAAKTYSDDLIDTIFDAMYPDVAGDEGDGHDAAD